MYMYKEKRIEQHASRADSLLYRQFAFMVKEEGKWQDEKGKKVNRMVIHD